jgi:predicted DNA-binding transcriptional regulator AlpA
MSDSPTATAPEPATAHLLDKRALAALLDKPALAALLDKRALAALLACSPRHVDRLADAGRMPPPVHLGALVRWRRRDIEDWLAGGCRPCRTAGRADIH